jgi:hypothetical protein
MDDVARSKALADEYFQLQRIVEDFDAKALTIKAWSVTLSAAGIVTAYTQFKPIILLVAAFSALVFWSVEALWKTSQQAFYARIYAIEHAIAADEDLPPLQIATSWSHAWHENGRSRPALGIMAWPHVMLPHVLVAAAGLLLFLFVQPAP